MTATIKAMDFGDVLLRNRPRFIRERIPYSVMVELTHRCNLRCVHCYCPPRAARKGELTVEEFGVVFDKLAEAGTGQVCLTGGDPLLRPDFAEIYVEAKKRGFLVIVFTNGALVNDEHLDLWTSYRPRRIEITLYGKSERVYDELTQVRGAHRVVYENVRKLLDRGLPIELKTVALTLTRDEVLEMMAFAEDLGVAFRFDGRIHPRIDGSFKPLAYRLKPGDLADLETSTSKGSDFLVRQYETMERLDGNGDNAFSCGAGMLAATVDPYGRLHLCTIARVPGMDLLHNDFSTIWNGEVKEIRSLKRNAEAQDLADREGWIDKCPGFSRLEKGDLSAASDFLVDLARAEKRKIGKVGSGSEVQSPT